MKNYEVISEELLSFPYLEDFQQGAISDYIACPNENDCNYDGTNDRSCCMECKIKWLQKEFNE